MADRVINEHQISLNSVIFPIEGMVRESLISRFPSKQITGDYDFANEQILSNLIINDQRGGLLVEEMDESIHQDRYWWSTCETRFRSNILLPPLPTQLTSPTFAATAITNGDMELNSDWSGGAQSSEQARGASTYSWKVFDINQATQSLGSYDKGVKYTFTCWAYPDFAGEARIGINDGVSTQWSSNSTGTGAWEQLSVSVNLSPNATQLQVVLEDRTSTGGWSYFDDAAISVADSIGNPTQRVVFNSKIYWSFGTVLAKLNTGNTALTIVAGLPATITDLILASDGDLLIFLGDSDNYWSMTSGEVFTETNIALANLSLRWDGKTWKMAVDGRWFSSTNPKSATPTWTAQDASGGLDDYNLTPKSLVVYFDANGNQIPYCATTGPLMAYSDDANKWIETAVKLPPHDQSGLGLVVWNDALYLSGGLTVKKYIAGGTAIVQDRGLDEDDGLPQLRSGEIVKFIEGYKEFFALIDSTYEGSTSRSQVMSYDGGSWRTWWDGTPQSEGLDTYTEVDPNSRITVTSNRVTWTLIQRGEDAYVYKDKGVNHFSGDFVHNLTMNISSISVGTYVILWAVTNAIGSVQDLIDVSGMAHYIVARSSSTDVIRLYAAEMKSGIEYYGNYVTLDINTTYYLSVERDEGVGTYGTFYLRVYSDAAKTSLVGSVTQTLVDSKEDLQYLYGLQTLGGTGSFPTSGYVENLFLTIESDPVNKNMYSGIVTSVNKHQLLFSTTDGVYSITLQRTSRSPKKVSGYTYGSAGVHIPPRFDAGTKAFPKLATKLTLFLDDMSSNETVSVTYQIDQAQGALTSTWTTLLGEQTSDGRVEQTFGTGGVEFFDIQFRIALVRGGTNTLSPIVKGMVLSYLKLLGQKKSWTMTINLAEARSVGKTPKELYDSIVTILATNTLLAFTFRDGSDSSDTHYCFLHPFSAFYPTGTNWDGKIILTLVAV